LHHQTTAQPFSSKSRCPPPFISQARANVSHCLPPFSSQARAIVRLLAAQQEQLFATLWPCKSHCLLPFSSRPLAVQEPLLAAL